MTGAPRITRVTLRAGTPYSVVVEALLQGPLVLDRAIEVQVGDLGQRFNVYETDDGTTVLVRVEDELRG